MSDPASPNRRPLKTRQWSFFQRLATRLRDAGVSPNAISTSSVAFGCLAGACLAGTSMTDTTWVGRLLWLAAAGFMQLRLIANLLDGMVAIEGGKQSTIGELFNEVPDRLTDTAILVGAGYAAGSLPVLGTLGAIVSLFIAYVRAMGASAGVGQVFLGPMAKPQRMAILTITCVLHAILPAYWLYSASDRYSLIALSLALIIVGGVVTAVRRLLRIAALMKQSASGVD